MSLCLVGCNALQAAAELPGSSPGDAPGAAPDLGTVSTGPAGQGLPCNVDMILGASCRSCHGSPPSGGAPMPLMTYADLTAPAKSDPSKSVGEVCATRIASTNAPMPPTPPLLSSADIATFQSWVNSGMPMGSCSAPPTNPDPLGAAPTCTSGQTWTRGNQESPDMNPGKACIACHSSGEGPRFAIAGTVYPTGHEPDLCFGTSMAQIIITDATGKTLPPVVPNSAGNFYLSATTTIALPYHAAVVANGKTRAMSAAQMSGDCNSCHTQNGANGAPGRITLPQ